MVNHSDHFAGVYINQEATVPYGTLVIILICNILNSGVTVRHTLLEKTIIYTTEETYHCHPLSLTERTFLTNILKSVFFSFS